jgi:hypothetical protein
MSMRYDLETSPNLPHTTVVVIEEPELGQQDQAGSQTSRVANSSLVCLPRCRDEVYPRGFSTSGTGETFGASVIASVVALARSKIDVNGRKPIESENANSLISFE